MRLSREAKSERGGNDPSRSSYVRVNRVGFSDRFKAKCAYVYEVKSVPSGAVFPDRGKGVLFTVNVGRGGKGQN